MYYQTDIRMPPAVIRFGNAGDDAYYRGTRMQLGIAGVHLLPGVFPWPVRVTHAISPPLRLPRGLDPDDRETLGAAQTALWVECQAHLDRAVAERDRTSDVVDRTCRTVTSWLRRAGI